MELSGGVNFDQNPKPEDLTYYLSCEVLVKEITYDDEQSKGTSKISELMVFLKPRESTQRDLFYAAWLPDLEEQNYEVTCRAGNPIDGYFKCAVFRRSDRLQEKHLFVMSKGAEEDLKRVPNGFLLNIEVLPQNMEHLADQAKEFDLAINKNK